MIEEFSKNSPKPKAGLGLIAQSQRQRDSQLVRDSQLTRLVLLLVLQFIDKG